MPPAEVADILDRLGFESSASGRRAATCGVPTWRALDVTREIDVVEEVARIHGLDRVPATLPGGARSGTLTRRAACCAAGSLAATAGAGLTEAQT